jgi:hypothetical protein
MGQGERMAIVRLLRTVLRQVGGSEEQSEALLLLLQKNEGLRKEVRSIMADSRLQPRLHPGKQLIRNSILALQRRTLRCSSSLACRTTSE